MGIKKDSQRSTKISITGSELYTLSVDKINGQIPNVFNIRNYGADVLYVGKSASLNTSDDYLILVPSSGGVATFTEPNGLNYIYFLSASNLTVSVDSFISDEIFSNELYQTLSTTVINSSLTSSVNINAPIPAGSNTIGNVGLNGSLPTGSNTIGNVGLNGSLPTGSNTIGNVGLSGSIPTGSNTIGKFISVDNSGAELDYYKDGDIYNANDHAQSLLLLDNGIPNRYRFIRCDTNGNQFVLLNGSIPTGTNTIGKVNIGTIPNEMAKGGNPTIYNVTLTNANTQYSQAITSNTKKFSVSIMDGTGTDNYRIAWETGKVAAPTAPYLKYPQNVEYSEDNIYFGAGLTLYLASSVAGKTAQIIIWT